MIEIRKTARILILEEIKQRLLQVTRENRYDFDIKTVQITESGYQLGDHQFKIPGAYIWLTNDQTNSELLKKNIRVGIVTIWLFDKATKETEPIYISEMLSSNAWVALNRSADLPRFDDKESPYLGGFVHDITLSNSEILASELNRPWYGAELTFEIKYVTKRDSPFILVTKEGKQL